MIGILKPYAVWSDIMIKVIEQTTAERNQESLELYKKCKPFLQQGMSLRQAVIKVTGKKGGFSRRAWYSDLKKLARADNFEIKLR